MTPKMSKEEFDGQMKRFGYTGITSVCRAVWYATGADILPQAVRAHLDRFGHLSSQQTATFRLFFDKVAASHGRV